MTEDTQNCGVPGVPIWGASQIGIYPSGRVTDPPEQAHPGYFRHIDGMRALAIIPVVLYHLFPYLCPGGFTGVDVFFVISGFLITRGIVSDLSAGRFSITSFYVRRIKRILPAYFVLIAFVLIALPFSFSFYTYRSVCSTAIYSAFYSANIFFYRVISYFDLGAKENPLLHLWSLGVEEQFYLVVPGVMWFLWAIKRSLFLYNLLFLFATSLACSTLGVSHGHSQFAFFMLPSRAWELLAGSMISQVPFQRLPRLPYAAASGWLGLLLVLVPYGLYSESTPFPGLAAVPSVLGASLLICFGNLGPLNDLLSWNPVVFIGKISYSLYLWHWPIFILLGSASSPARAAAAVMVSIAASVLSYRFIELPIRRNRAFGPREAFGMLIIGNILIVAPCWIVIHGVASKNGDLPKTWNGVPTWRVAEEARDKSRSTCSLEELEAPNSKFLIKIGKTTAPPTFVLWGDSLGLAMLPGVDSVASEYGKAGYYVNLKHGLSLEADIGIYPFDPRRDREPVLRWLESRPDIADVFLVNHWFGKLGNVADIQETVGICERLHKAGKRIFFFNDPPVSSDRALYPLSWGRHVDITAGAVSREAYDSMATQQTQLANELTTRNLAVVIPTDKAFLNGTTYFTTTETESFYIDPLHLNRTGAIRAMRFVAPMVWSHP
jgi:peptidoglycan/LPS O-acetylase OafA/YrhL